VVLAGRVWPNGEAWAGHMGATPPMGLSNLRKNHKPDRGHNGITSHGRRTVRQGAFLLEERIGKSDLSFLTCTLPGATLDECRTANENWGEIMRRFLQELKRELERKNLDPWIIGCTEIQPKRFARTGQPWPHCHLVFPGRDGKNWAIRPARINLLWARCCKAVIGGGLGDYLASTRIEVIKTKKSVGQYLGKYMSKGGEEINAMRERIADWPIPKAWHHCTHTLNQYIRGSIATLTPKSAAWLFKIFQTKYPGSKVWSEVAPTPTINSPFDAPLGYYGMLDPPLAARLILFNTQEKQPND
jgi:hypothetical protein